MVHTHCTAEGPQTVEIVASPVFDETGDVVHVIEACRDITGRVLTADTMAAHNDFDDAQAVKPTVFDNFRLVQIRGS